MLKKITTLFMLNLLLFASSSRTMFNDYGSYDRSGFVTTDIKFSSINNYTSDTESVPTVFYGTSAALLFDNNFYGGVGIYTSTANIFKNGEIIEGDIDLTYVGGIYGYTAEGYSEIHTNFNILVGAGIATDTAAWTSDFIIIFEPELAVEMNITNFAKAKVGWSWRITRGVDAAHCGTGIFDPCGYGNWNNINFSLIFGEY